MDSLRGRVYLSKQRIKRQVRGSLVIVSEIRETLRLFTRLVAERDVFHEKDYITKITKAREDEDSMAFQRECRFVPFRVFSPTFGLFGFLASFATTLFSIFNVPRVPRA